LYQKNVKITPYIGKKKHVFLGLLDGFAHCTLGTAQWACIGHVTVWMDDRVYVVTRHGDIFARWSACN